TGVVARAGILVVARGAVEQRSVADAGAVLAGVGGGTGVAVIAARARERRHRAARRPVAGPRVALVRGAVDGGADALPAAGAGVVERAGVAGVAGRRGVGGYGAARRAVAGPRVALVGGAGDGGADALPAARAGIVERAGVAVVARRARVGGHGAARRAVTGLGVALVGGARDRRADALPAAGAAVVVGAGVAVVAARARERRYRAARRPVAGPRVAGIRGARDGGADALAAAVAGIVERAGVAVVAARARERRHRAARRAVAGLRVALVRGARDVGADALPADVAGIVERAGVAVVSRGTVCERRVVTSREIAGVRGAGVPVVAGRGVGQRIGHHQLGRGAVRVLMVAQDELDLAHAFRLVLHDPAEVARRAGDVRGDVGSHIPLEEHVFRRPRRDGVGRRGDEVGSRARPQGRAVPPPPGDAGLRPARRHPVSSVDPRGGPRGLDADPQG